MHSKAKKRIVVAVAILVAFVLFVVPLINVNRYRLMVARSLSDSLGREVTVQGVSLQTFPRPGLLLSDVTVADDPSISAEPILHAGEVLATLRLSSLWRARLEIASLKFSYPSLNLARSPDGRWNISSLLERARQIPTAPTAKTRPEARNRFPYIESSGGRINVKIGPEKTVYALSDADFSLWLAAEDEWRMRLEARPIRTDSNLSDTGTIKMEGVWRRAPQLQQTPVSLKVWWDYGQLGQLTHLISGYDHGWRGTVTGSATLNGTPEQLRVVADLRIDDFRRYDIATSDSLSLQAHCDADYAFVQKRVQDVACKIPAGTGMVNVAGNLGYGLDRDSELRISAEKIPAQFLAALARRAKRNLPNDLSAAGLVDASLTMTKAADGSQVWAGSGHSTDVKLTSQVLSEPLVISATNWQLLAPNTQTANEKHAFKRTLAKASATPTSAAWKLEPVQLNLGASNPATLTGSVSRANGYDLQLSGDAGLARLFELGRLLGVAVPDTRLTGTAKGKLAVSGSWMGFPVPAVTADAQLHAVTAKLSGVASPLKIASAHFVADRDSYSLTKASGSFAGVHSELEFSATWPRNCTAQAGDLSACEIQFGVTADQLSIDELNSLLNPHAQKHPWYAALANVIDPQRRKFPAFSASGHISTTKLLLKSVTASHVSSDLKLTPAGFQLTNLTADVLGGKFLGEVSSDFTGNRPLYSSKAKLQKLTLNSVATAMHDPWASGTLTASYEGTAAGWSADEIASSATANINFQWHDGALQHIQLEGGKPLQFKDFIGTAELRNGTLRLTEGKLRAARGIYEVSGTASLGRQLGLKLVRNGAPEFSVSGTLERPKVTSVKTPQTQAALQ